MPSFIRGEWQDGEVRGVNFLAGFRGMGKTTEMGRLMNQCSGRVIFWDFTGNHPSLLSRAECAYQPGELKDLLMSGTRRVRYIPFDEKFVEHFQAVCAICKVFGQMVFCIDEMDNCCGSEWKKYRMPPELYQLVHMGRHHKVSLIFTARDPTTISPNVRSQCKTIRVFRTVEEQYVRYFQARIGKEMASRLFTLPEYQYVLSDSDVPQVHIYSSGRKIL